MAYAESLPANNYPECVIELGIRIVGQQLRKLPEKESEMVNALKAVESETLMILKCAVKGCRTLLKLSKNSDGTLDTDMATGYSACQPPGAEYNSRLN